MPKVYISSTVKDLQEERKAAADAVLMLKDHCPVMMEYGRAGERKPLDEVRDDIRGCDLFVGIYGLRYGYVPPGETKSITHLEYEAAGAAGIPRLIFIRDKQAPFLLDHVDEDKTAINNFRHELEQGHWCVFFKSAEALKAAVMGSLSNQRPAAAESAPAAAAREVPTLLPYLCDRSEQETELAFALDKHRAQKPLRPFVCVVHGDQLECHDQFLERMCVNILPKNLGRGERDAPLKHYPVEWPAFGETVNARMRQLLSSLGDKLCCSRVADTARMAEAVALQGVPVVVSTSLWYTSWRREDELQLIRRWLRFWSDWPPAAARREVFVVLCVHYKEGEPSHNGEEPGTPAPRGPADAAHIREQLGRLSYGKLELSGLTLPQLRGIPLSEVHHWVKNYGSLFRPADEVMRQAREFYEQLRRDGRGQEVPMENLAEMLRSWVA